jgi:hypothetical protein
MKEFILNLDKPRRLIYDFDAWDLIIDKYGDKKEEENFDVSKLNITTRELPFLAFAGMKWEDPELTEQKTKALLNEAIQSGAHTILSILGPVSEAIFAQSGLTAVPVEVGKPVKKAAGPAALVPGSRKKGK